MLSINYRNSQPQVCATSICHRKKSHVGLFVSQISIFLSKKDELPKDFQATVQQTPINPAEQNG